jgi:hypothetical protein
MGEIIEPSVFPSLLPATSQENKKKNWGLVEEYIDRITDGLGMPVDEDIKNPVIVLNLLGIRTRQSCAGHVDRSLAPWITITWDDSSDVIELRKNADEIRATIKELRKTKDLTSHEIISLYEQYHTLNRKSDIPQLTECQKVLNLLCEFYTNRLVRADIHLCISRVGRIESIGYDFIEIQHETIKESKIKEYQNEMTAFSNFLVNKYFKN